jgi:hypothetical protein
VHCLCVPGNVLCVGCSSYVDVIYRMLRPGGVWINLGPLLYHWVADVEGNQDDRYDQSIEVRIFCLFPCCTCLLVCALHEFADTVPLWCMVACMYVCTFVRMYVYVCMYVCLYICVHVCVCMHECS